MARSLFRWLPAVVALLSTVHAQDDDVYHRFQSVREATSAADWY